MPKVSLRKFISTDTDVLNSIRNDKEALRLMNAKYSRKETKEGTLIWVERQAKTHYFRVIESNEKCCGFIKVSDFSFGDLCTQYKEIGIAISQAARNQGIAGDALKLIIEELPKERNFIARIFDTNIPSVRLFQNFGFNLIGEICRQLESEKAKLGFYEFIKKQ